MNRKATPPGGMVPKGRRSAERCLPRTRWKISLSHGAKGLSSANESDDVLRPPAPKVAHGGRRNRDGLLPLPPSLTIESAPVRDKDKPATMPSRRRRRRRLASAKRTTVAG